ncbi:MAG: hypothetical protein NDI81_10220 [Desulfobacula sp.]|nr:hypothetical protein [Desulfobacula sp.]
MSVSLEHISQDLQTQWQDHFHMRDQTWKVLQYSILFFLGVVGLEIKGVDVFVLVVGYIGVSCTSLSGLTIALHHRRRQKEKFDIIYVYEKELGLYELIEPILKKSKKGVFGRINTTNYIVVMQLAIAAVSIILLVKRIK